MSVLTFPQATTRTIWVRNMVDGNNAPLDVTGWAVLATATGPGPLSTVVEQWSTSPTGNQGQATATGTSISLAVPASMSASWLIHYAMLDISVTEPGPGGRTERFAPVGLIITPTP